MATATSEAVRLPPVLRAPKPLQGVAFLLARRRLVAALGRRYGNVFTLNLPGFGQTVVVGDPEQIQDLFGTSRELLGRSKLNLGRIFGPGSMFNLSGDEHLARRRLLSPPFHSVHVAGYRRIVEEELRREFATWPEGREFETLPAMTRITLRGLLRVVIGADGVTLDELSTLMPPAVAVGARLGLLPPILRKDFGAWSPGARILTNRRKFDAAVFALMAQARCDPALRDRHDVLALLVQSRYAGGAPMSDAHIADELLSTLTAGYETTAATLAWAVERLRRHPRVLSRLTGEIEAGESDFLQAVIWEVQRARPVSDVAQRRTTARIRLGEWVIPQGTTLMINVPLSHSSTNCFPDADAFDPDRFVGADHKPAGWIPYGGGFQRCIGAAYANMAMTTTLRTLLREFRLLPTTDPGERPRDHGVIFAPEHGALAVVERRTTTDPGPPL